MPLPSADVKLVCLRREFHKHGATTQKALLPIATFYTSDEASFSVCKADKEEDVTFTSMSEAIYGSEASTTRS